MSRSSKRVCVAIASTSGDELGAACDAAGGADVKEQLGPTADGVLDEPAPEQAATDTANMLTTTAPLDMPTTEQLVCHEIAAKFGDRGLPRCATGRKSRRLRRAGPPRSTTESTTAVGRLPRTPRSPDGLLPMRLVGVLEDTPLHLADGAPMGGW